MAETEDNRRKYETQKVLYEGKYSKIYLAKVKNSRGRPNVIIKASSNAARIATEISGFRKLYKEKHILKIYGICDGPSGDAIAMERCVTSLHTLVFQSKSIVSNDERRSIARQFLYGLEAIHSKNLVHRDLKPENILVSFDGVVKISDFESISENNTQPHSRIRTPGYTAIEVLMGDKKALQSLDLWSAGCVLYEVFTGRRLLAQSRDDIQSELGYLTKMFGCVKGPYFEELPEYPDYYEWAKMFTENKFHLRLRSKKLTEEEIKIIESLLTIDPSKRAPVAELLKKEIFTSSSVPETIQNVVRRFVRSRHIKPPALFQGSCWRPSSDEAQLRRKAKEEGKFVEACGGHHHQHPVQAPALEEEEGKFDEACGGDLHQYTAKPPEQSVGTTFYETCAGDPFEFTEYEEYSFEDASSQALDKEKQVQQGDIWIEQMAKLDVSPVIKKKDEGAKKCPHHRHHQQKEEKGADVCQHHKHQHQKEDDAAKGIQHHQKEDKGAKVCQHHKHRQQKEEKARAEGGDDIKTPPFFHVQGCPLHKHLQKKQEERAEPVDDDRRQVEERAKAGDDQNKTPSFLVLKKKVAETKGRQHHRKQEEGRDKSADEYRKQQEKAKAIEARRKLEIERARAASFHVHMKPEMCPHHKHLQKKQEEERAQQVDDDKKQVGERAKAGDDQKKTPEEKAKEVEDRKKLEEQRARAAASKHVCKKHSKQQQN